MKARDRKKLLEEPEKLEKMPIGEILTIVQHLDKSYEFRGEKISAKKYELLEKHNTLVVFTPSAFM